VTLLVGAALATGGMGRRAAASDGVIEINQAAIAARGGFPYVIDALGSYRLTSDLVVPDENTTAIRVAAPNVTLDLNGFAISGPTVCSAPPVTNCAPTGTGIGIDGRAVVGIRVWNGTVRGMGSWGLVLGAEAVVEDVSAVSNGLRGIQVDHSARVIRGFALRNGSDGIWIGHASIVRDTTANENQQGGIAVATSSLLQRNVAARNRFRGMEVFSLTVGVVFVQNAAGANGSEGIFAAPGTVISENTANENMSGIQCNVGCSLRGNTASRNFGAPPFASTGGIRVWTGCSLVSNTARENSAFGLEAILEGGFNGIAHNALTANALGAIEGPLGSAAIETAPNVCGAAPCSSP